MTFNSSPKDHSSVVLNVVDRGESRQAYTRILTEAGVVVHEASSGAQALGLLESLSPDVVLLDAQLPDISGYEVCRRIKSSPAHGPIPVVQVASSLTPQSELAASEGGADAYLVAPADPLILIATIKSMIRIRRAERRLRDSEEFLRRMLENSPDCIKLFDLEGRLNWINQPGIRSLELPDLDSVRGQPWNNFWHDQDRGAAEKALAEARAGRPSAMDRYRPTSSGTPKWWNVLVTPILDSQGRPERILALSRDITDRRAMEQALRDSEARLESEVATLTRLHRISTQALTDGDLGSALSEILTAAIDQTRADCGVLYTYNASNQHLESAVQRGMSAEFLDLFSTVPPGAACPCARAIANRSRVIIEDAHVAPIFENHRGMLGALGFRGAQSTPLFSRAGEPLGVLATHFKQPYRHSDADFRSLDMLGRHAADILDHLRFRSAMEQSNRRKDEFLAMLAHELRNPLAPICSSLAVMHLTPQDSESTSRHRTIIDRQVKQLVRLVDDLLDVSRISTGKMSLRPSVHPISAIIDAAIETCRPRIDADGHQLVVSMPNHPVFVNADDTRLTQVVFNLINNAAMYSPAGKQITVDVTTADGWCTINVKDQGIGISESNLPRIFDLFAQGETMLEKSRGGLGIGLCLVKKIVELHGGQVSAHSPGPGLGSTFQVRIPAVPQETAPTPATSARPTTPSPSLKPSDAPPSPLSRRVLVVDDNVDAAETLKGLLLILGNTVRTANDGMEALAQAASFMPDVIILDIGMPILNGYEAARRIREIPGLQNVRIIALTGWGQEEDRRRSADAGFDHHLVKPIDLDELEKLVLAPPSRAPPQEFPVFERLPTRLWATVIAALCVGAVVIGACIYTSNLSQRLLDATLEQRQSLEALNEFFHAIKDAETGQRGYLITGDANYRQPYDSAMIELDAKLAKVVRSYPPEPRLDRLVAAANRRTQLLRATVDKFAAGDTQGAVSMIAQGQGKLAMDEVRRIVGEMTEESRAIIIDRRTRAILARQTSVILTVGGIVALIAFVVLLNGTIAAQLARREAVEENLRDSQARLHTTLSSMGEGLITTDAAGNVNFMNPVAEVLTGIRVEEAASKTLDQVFIARNNTTRHTTPLRLPDSFEPSSLSSTIPEVVLAGPEGRERPVEYTISNIYSPRREYFGRVLIFRDALHRMSAERERESILAAERAARAEAERIARTKDEFVATLSHELRTPLNSILGWTQILRRSTADADTVSQGLEIIERNTRLQTRLISDLLDASRMLSGKVRLDVQSTDLPLVVKQAVMTVRPTAETRGVELTEVIDPLAGPISGDPARLQQIIWNLLTNAIKFTPRGGKVRIELCRVNSHVEIVVADTGEGIDADFLPWIFDRFRQADSSTTRTHGGLGLGLSIVKQLVELHGGTVRASSPGKGKGARFVVALPIASVREHAGADPRVHPESVHHAFTPVAESPLLRNIRVLVVDDEHDARMLVKRVLEERGAAVLTVDSAQAALASLNDFGPDIIVSDLGMPVQDGFQFIQTLRKRPHEQFGGVPAIALTAFARSEDRTRALLAGFQSHVAKPVDVAELIATVAALAHVSTDRGAPLKNRTIDA